MKRFFENLKIRYKLQIPNGLYVIILAIIVVLYFSASARIKNLELQQAQLGEISNGMRDLAIVLQEYMGNAVEWDTAVAEYEHFQEIRDNASIADELTLNWTAVEAFHEKEMQNAAIEKEIFDLTAVSMKQSNGFIATMVDRLADETQRNAVTTLERMVIKGANMNTSANYEIRVLFLKLKESIQAKAPLLKFLDTLEANTEKDIQNLAGTPFQDMAIAAQAANQTIKKQVKIFINNMETQNALRREITETLLSTLNQLDQRIMQETNVMFAGISQALMTIVLSILIACVIGGFFTWGVSRGIVTALQKAVDMAKVMRAGDLSRRLQMRRRDEIGEFSMALDSMADGLSEKAALARTIADGDLTRNVAVASEKDVLSNALSAMVNNLNSLIGQVNASVEQVTAGAGQISEASQTLSQGATEQASSLEETNSVATEIASQTKDNVEKASHAKKLSETALEACKEGNRLMEKMVAGMAGIIESSREIEKINKTIDDIAFQTNLLALNAAVEAARAGRHGKGFAVVAQEVRTLANKSSKAVNDTTALIDTAIKNVTAGNEITEETARALETINENVKQTADLNNEIAAASSEQAQGIGQINEALSQIDSVTQQNAANAEETAAASQELNSQTVLLRNLLKRFKLRDAQAADFHQAEAIEAPQRNSLEEDSGDDPAMIAWGE
ncbi:MAG: methyl-accepting chemotaxis protein [Thermodesulfobacteriota bacterium]|nr:methyl-accepting chemotaxis protein [Thermodesulfobacteriota bacterium]